MTYVHGYQIQENARLQDQAFALQPILLAGTAFAPGSRVLEAGCGVGAQTVVLASNNPGAFFTSVDVSPISVELAKEAVAAANLSNVSVQQADIFHLPFEPESFDHVFVCFVLEHLAQPAHVLASLRKVLKPGGSITVIEGDHGSVLFFPSSQKAMRAIRCQIELQASMGGNALIGRQLYPLLMQAGFQRAKVDPKIIYVDDSNPALVNGFTKKTFAAMIAGVRDAVLEAQMMRAIDFDEGIRDLHRTADGGGTFCYTFFKAMAYKSDAPVDR